MVGLAQAHRILDIARIRDQVAPVDRIRVAELIRRVTAAQDDQQEAIRKLARGGTTVANLEAESDALWIDRSDLDPRTWDAETTRINAVWASIADDDPWSEVDSDATDALLLGSLDFA